MFDFRFGRTRDAIVAIVDISESGVGAALLSVSQNSRARVLSEAFVEHAAAKRTPKELRALLGTSLDTVSKQIIEQAGKRHHLPVQYVYCIVHAPLVRSQTVRALTRLEKDEVVQDEHILEIARKALANEKFPKSEEVFESGVMRIWLNGYPIHDPAGKTAHTISVSAVLSMSDDGLRESLNTALARNFPTARIMHRSATRAFLTVFGDIPTVGESYLAIHIDMDNTHILSVRDGTVTEQRVIGGGVREILSKVSKQYAPDELLGLLGMIERDACEKNVCDTIRSALASTEPELVRTFGEPIGSIASERRVSNTLVVIAPRDISPWLERFFTRIDFSQFTVTSLPFTITDTVRTNVQGYFENAENVSTPLLIASVLAIQEMRR